MVKNAKAFDRDASVLLREDDAGGRVNADGKVNGSFSRFNQLISNDVEGHAGLAVLATLDLGLWHQPQLVDFFHLFERPLKGRTREEGVRFEVAVALKV